MSLCYPYQTTLCWQRGVAGTTEKGGGHGKNLAGLYIYSIFMFQIIIITEDLSPFRLKLLHYIKDCNKELEMFDRITTRNGNITCRKKGTSEWFTITSPDDFLQAGIPMKRSEFEKELLF